MTVPGPGAASFGLALRLARRELRGGLRGFRAFLASLILGIGAITAVGTLTESLLAGLRDDGRVLLGGDLDLRLVHREITAEQRAWLEARGRLSQIVELRAMAHTMADGDGRRALIELRAVDSAYPLYGAVELRPARPLAELLAYRDGAWGLAADASLLRRFDLDPASIDAGTRLRIGELTYEIRALVAREPDRSTRIAAFGPRVLVAYDSLAETGLLQPGSLNHHHYRLRLPEGGDPAAVRRGLAEAFPDAGWRVRDTSQAAPGLARFIDRLGLFLTLVGLTALLIGGVGIGNAVRGYLESRTATIATLKCLGASGRLIARVYWIQILALALLGIAAGLALGLAAAYLAGTLLGEVFAWRTVIAVHPRPLLTAAAYGLLTAAAFSLWPLAHARALSPASLFRDKVAPAPWPRRRLAARAYGAIGLVAVALAGLVIAASTDRWVGLWFVLCAAGALLLFHGAGIGLVALLRRVPRPRRMGLRLALANLVRPGAATVSVVTSFGLGLTVLVAIVLVEANLTRALSRTLPDQAPALYFIDIQPDQVALFDRIVRATPGAGELRRIPMLRGRIVSVNGVPPERLEIPPEIAWVFRGDRGLTWSREPPPNAEISAGSWWPPDYQGPPLVSLDAAVAGALGIGPGDRIGVNVLGRDIEAEIASLRVIDWTGLGLNFVLIFSPGLLEAAPQIHIATVEIAPGAGSRTRAEVEDELERAVTDRFANVSAIRVRDALDAVLGIMGHVALAVHAAAAVALLASIVVLGGALAAGQHLRIYDAVVLKVLGATRGRLLRVYLMEYGFLGLATAALAAVIGTLAAYLVVTKLLHLGFSFLAGPVAAVTLPGVAVTLGLGFLGTWRALDRKAAPLLRNQ
ncbi:MAG: FtsX-like permease family protein [Proteobacteria bacterium]|nr:FtsX-like permease family protein [Pseudomonadota bacterium]